jgi:hypothetical protein
MPGADTDAWCSMNSVIDREGGMRTFSAPARQAPHFEESSHSRSHRAASVAGACISGSYVQEISFADYSKRSKAMFGPRR